MTETSVQWDMPRPSAADIASNWVNSATLFPYVLDVIDTAGRHYGGFGERCVPLGATLWHCTIDWPGLLHHAPLATFVLRMVPLGGGHTITLRVHPG
jgi:hypothetical protein